MQNINEIKTKGQDENAEAIIRQHRRLTHQLENRRTIGEGSLVLTNRRLLFLHRIEASSGVTATIKKLADAPMNMVLDHALTLNKNSFQMPLSSIVRVGIGTFAGFPLPHFYLWLNYLKGKNNILHTVSFQFGQSQPGIFFKPQVFVDWEWKSAIEKAVKETFD
jgi:hypothetical protein